MRFVALLRGINVGQGPRVPMADLKALFERVGLRDVITYLNSGNVLFDSELGAADLTRLLESELESTYGARIQTLGKTSAEVVAIAEAIPREWGSDAGQQTYVAYLFPDADDPALVAQLPVRAEFMSMFHTPGAIVWNIKRENYNRSHITKIAGHSSYARMTTRNVNTARKLAELVAGARETAISRSE